MKLYVLSIGVVNMTSGKTMYDWSIYDNGPLFAYLTDKNYILFGAEGSLKIGDRFEVFNDQSRRSLGSHQNGEVIDISPCKSEELLAMLKKHGYDYYPIKAFKKRSMTKKLKTSYVLK